MNKSPENPGNNRTLSLALWILLLALGVSQTAHAQPTLAGNVSYDVSGNTATLNAARINNYESYPSGTLALQLWATTFGYDGIATHGYLTAQATIGYLPANTYAVNISEYADFTDPPNGNYRMVMALAEWNGVKFEIIDYINFSTVQTFGETQPAKPAIYSPLSVNAVVWQSFNYSIKATNNPIEYRVNGTNLPPGITYNRYTGVISGTPTTHGTYFLNILAGNDGGVDAKVLKILIARAPMITSQPVSRAVYLGEGATFSVFASGYPNISYQWQKNGMNIPGATGSSYGIAKTQLSDAGNYRVVMSNQAGSTTSSPATLTVCNYTTTPGYAFFGPEGGTSNFFVNVAGGCSWDVVNTNSWISITVGGNGNGNGGFTYSVSPNTGTDPRVGHLTVGNRTVPIAQNGALAPAAIDGKTIVPTINSIPSGLIVTDKGTNTYTLLTTNGVAAATGTFAYSKTSTNTAEFIYGPEEERVTVTMTFNTPTAGSFTSTNGSGDSAAGTFVINDNKPDYNNDAQPDILWHQQTSRVLAAWLMNGTNFIRSTLVRNGTPTPVGWRVVGNGDMNQDGKPDIILQHQDGKMAAWFMNGTNILSSLILRGGTPAASGWRAVAVADFNGDNSQDILFQHDSRILAVWYFTGTNFLVSKPLRNGLAAAAGWTAVGVNDFNGDGETDVLWHHTNGQLAVWSMVRGIFVSSVPLRNGQPAGPGWKVVAIGDFNNDGRNDILFQHDIGRLAVWFMDRDQFKGTALLRNGLTPGQGWRVVGPK